MIDFYMMLEQEERHLTKIQSMVEERLEHATKGSLNLCSRNNKPQFYMYSSKDEPRKYLSQDDVELIKKLAQKEYDNNLIEAINGILPHLKMLIRKYEALNKNVNNKTIEVENGQTINETRRPGLESVYTSMHEMKRKFVTPVEPTWEMRVEEWLRMPYEGLGFKDDGTFIITENGLRVRSKSEKIIAEFLDRKGIPFKYESPMRLREFGVVYPDFTLMSKSRGGLVYWEHFGRMDDPEYANKAIRKIQSYENDGYYIGGRLIVTFETERTVLNTRTLEAIVRNYFQ